MKKIHLPLLCTASIALFCGHPATAAGTFPEHEINLTVNFGAGGNTDVAARVLAKAMEKSLGKPIVIQNRPGALGTLGVTFVSRQKADGYNVGVVTYSTQAIVPHLMDVSYKMMDFQYISGFGRYRYGVVVRGDSPYKTIKDLVEASKSGKGVFFGTESVPITLAMSELGRASGGKFEQISYKSGPETVIAVLSGQVDVAVPNPSDVLPYLKSGKLRLLASASPTRWPEEPNVQTLREVGYPVEIVSWMGLAVPKGTPADIVAKLQAASLAAVKDEDVRKNFMQLGVEPATLTGKEYEDVLKKGYEDAGRAIKAANLPRISG